MPNGFCQRNSLNKKKTASTRNCKCQLSTVKIYAFYGSNKRVFCNSITLFTLYFVCDLFMNSECFARTGRADRCQRQFLSFIWYVDSLSSQLKLVDYAKILVLIIKIVLISKNCKIILE